MVLTHRTLSYAFSPLNRRRADERRDWTVSSFKRGKDRSLQDCSNGLAVRGSLIESLLCMDVWTKALFVHASWIKLHIQTQKIHPYMFFR